MMARLHPNARPQRLEHCLEFTAHVATQSNEPMEVHLANVCTMLVREMLQMQREIDSLQSQVRRPW